MLMATVVGLGGSFFVVVAAYIYLHVPTAVHKTNRDTDRLINEQTD